MKNINMSHRAKYILSLVVVSLCGIRFANAQTTTNYVMTNTVKQSGVINETQVNALAIAVQGKSQTIAYLDGLGRPSQNVITKGSASQKDIVIGIEYDVYGREVKKYLPYADQTSTNYGSYKDRWTIDQGNFYKGVMPNVDPDVAPFTVSVLESSPLNRVLGQGYPGTTWQPNPTNTLDPLSHISQIKYIENKLEDNVRFFTVDSLGNFSSSAYYAAGTLIEKITSDEQQQTVKEFTDKLGHIVLKRVMMLTDSLQTYYIYDDMDKLRGVIQPEGSATLQAAGWVFPGTFKSLWMFLYRYDERGRMVMKKVPGADSVLMFYDTWDRVVLTQDGNLRTGNNFLFTKYDALNRPIVTGQITDTRSRDVIRTSIMSGTGRFETVNTAATEGYTLTGCFPSSASYTLTIYTITHYDSYTNLPSWSSSYAFVNEYSIATRNLYLTGQVVATQTRILGSSTFLRTVLYYDDKYHVIQTIADNTRSGKDRITKILSFDGKVTSDYHTHTSTFYSAGLLTQETYTYDHMDRLLTTTHKTGTQEVVTLSQITYNELGQQLNKKLHQSPSHPNPLQKLDYYYNIRGWLNSVNRPVTSKTGYEEADLFNFELHYENVVKPDAVAQYNGNISEFIYKGGYDEPEYGYNHFYDKANRDTASTWAVAAANGSSSWIVTRKYDESAIEYDRNGNILLLQRYFGDWNNIDYLGYKAYNGNQLLRVDDYSTATIPVGFQNKNPANNIDYTYDNNGNLISDYNKDITSITYNYLNLPNIVTMTGKGTITFTYDATGNKLQKSTFNQLTGKTNNYFYTGDYVYKSGGSVDTLEFISQPEGRLRPMRIDTTQAISVANLKYIYDYFIKDHLGSTRSVITTEQQTDLYAANMETAAAAKEDALFKNVSGTSNPVPAGFTNDINNKKASKLNGAIGTAGNQRVGPSIVLKVMVGDTISISTNSWYTGAVQPPATLISDIITDLVPLLSGGVSTNGGGKGGAILTSFSDPLLTADMRYFLDSTRSYLSNRPKAFLNWMVVDEQFAAVKSNNHTNAIQIPVCNTGDTSKQIVGLNQLVVRRNGYIYVYVSNESSQYVYFDNLVVNLKHGPLLEQKDYYVFGMENPALSTKAIKQNYDQNRKMFNGIEYDSTFGFNMDDAFYRNYDPQIGRWMQIDPKPNMYESPYSAMGNNPILHSDPLGDTLRGVDGQSAKRELGIVKETFKGNNSLQALFNLKGNSFKKINDKDFAKATAKSSKDQKALANGYKEAINSTTTHNVEVVKQDEKLSSVGQDATGYTTGKQINDQDGGGVSTSLTNGDRYEAIVIDATNPVPAVDRVSGANVSLPGSPGEISAHEIIGHQLADIHNSINASGLNSIQAGNLYLRSQGTNNLYRDSHMGLPFSSDKVEEIPPYLK